MKKKYIAGIFALMTLMIQAQPLPPPAVGNRPHIITDDADPQTVYGAMEFNDGSNSGQEYFYDACGSLVADANKGIAHIDYDNCNYPKKIQFTNGNTIEYVYTPDGQKLRAKYQTAIDDIVVPLNTTANLNSSQIVNTTQTDYIGNVIYTGSNSGAITTTSLNKCLFAGGYATFYNTVPTYHYYTQDHLGNNRAVVNDNGTVEQITHYYPFGGTYADVGLNSSLQPYKYNGKELDRMHGLNLYDYGARHYDAIVPMFTQIDPLAEKYYNFSPYVYCGNRPMNCIDLEGEKVVFVNGYLGFGSPEGGEAYWNGANSSFVVGALSFFNDNDTPYFTNYDFKYLESSNFGREIQGYNYAKDNYTSITSGMKIGVDKFNFVSHSMGGAFSEGMIRFLSEQGWETENALFLNAWEPTRITNKQENNRIDATITNDPVQRLSSPLFGEPNIPKSDVIFRTKSDESLIYIHRDFIDGDDNFWDLLNK